VRSSEDTAQVTAALTPLPRARKRPGPTSHAMAASIRCAVGEQQFLATERADKLHARWDTRARGPYRLSRARHPGGVEQPGLLADLDDDVDERAWREILQPGRETGMAGSARSSTWLNKSSSDCRQLASWARASPLPTLSRPFRWPEANDKSGKEQRHDCPITSGPRRRSPERRSCGY
jgi:hypothetical protein